METDTKRKRNVRSWLWEFFEDLANEKAKCCSCGAIIDHANGTNSMKHHLSTQHQIFNSNKKLKPQEFKDSFLLTSKLYVFHLFSFSFSCLFFRLYFFAECHIPLNIVESNAFIDMMQVACPTFKVPTRTNLRDYIVQEAQEVKKMVCLCLK